MKFSSKIKMAMLTVLIAVSSVACGDGSKVDNAINATVSDFNATTAIVEQTITVTTDMVENTVIDGCGAFNPCN